MSKLEWKRTNKSIPVQPTSRGTKYLVPLPDNATKAEMEEARKCCIIIELVSKFIKRKEVFT